VGYSMIDSPVVLDHYHSYLSRSDANTFRLTGPHASQLVAPPVVFALRRIWCWLVLELGNMFRCGTSNAQALCVGIVSMKPLT
jgi:hypothetical protein